MTPTLEISFGCSKAFSYDTLVELAREFPTYSVDGSGAEVRHTVTVDGEEILSVEVGTLIDFCRELKSTRIRVNGRIIGRTEMWQLHLTRLPHVRECWNRLSDICDGKCRHLAALIETAVYRPKHWPQKAPPTLKDVERMVRDAAIDLCPAFDPERVPEILYGDVLKQLGAEHPPES